MTVLAAFSIPYQLVSANTVTTPARVVEADSSSLPNFDIQLLAFDEVKPTITITTPPVDDVSTKNVTYPPIPVQPKKSPPRANPQVKTTITGSHEDWMRQAGIPDGDFGSVDYIISRESGWRVNAVEPHSRAEGLPQALPYSKTGCAHGDGVCQLRWANGYAKARYGSWQKAQQYWVIHHNW